MIQKINLPARRRAFTLVELLIVISIIGLLAAFILTAMGPIKRNKAISAARSELEQYKNALEAYHSKYGVYPPANQNPNSLYNAPVPPPLPPNDRAQFSQLYYELSGTTINGGNFVTLDGANSIPTSTATTPPGGVMDAYGVGGFVNCTKGGGEDVAKAQNFLLNLSTRQVFSGYTNNHTLTTMLVTSVGGPDDTYMPLKVSGVNPIRYVCPGTNNPTSYDLWVQLSIGGKLYLVCNWNKSALVNTAYP